MKLLLLAATASAPSSTLALHFPYSATFPLHTTPYTLLVSAPNATTFSLALLHAELGPVLSFSHSPAFPLLAADRVNASFTQSGGTFVWPPLSPPIYTCSGLILSAAAAAPRGGAVVLSGAACGGGGGGGNGAWALSFAPSPDDSGHVSWRAEVSDGGAGAPTPALTLALLAPPSAPLLGLGTQFSALDLRGRVWPVWSREQGVGRGLEPVTSGMDALQRGAGGDFSTTYSHIPLLYIAAEAATTAVWLETLDFCEWDLREPGVARVTQLGRAAAGRVAAARTLGAAVESYTAFSGRPPPSPAWMETGAIVGLEGGTAAVLRALAAIDAAAPGAPLAGVWLQDWCGARDNTGFTQMPFYGVYWNWMVNETQYPGWHAVLLPALAARGARVLVYVNPMLMAGPLREEALAKGFLVRLQGGGLFDFDGHGTALVNVGDSAAAAWLAGVLQRNVLGDANASGWMADFGEGYPPDGAGGSPSAHGEFPGAWAAVNAAAVAAAGKGEEAVFFMRSASPRSPGLASAFWLGDQLVSWDAFDGLASAVTALLTSSLHGGGIAHADIGGYTTVVLRPPAVASNVTVARGKELFMRWAECAAFTFMFRTHPGNLPSANWQLTSDGETIRHFFGMARVYAGLKNYRSRVRANATARGTPPFLATAARFAGAPWALTGQFFLGEELLVAPVLTPGAASVSVWLPSGTRWRHALNASIVLAGEGATVEVPAPLGAPCALWLI
jgi:alpha-glucosidase